jgi:hypothetical protein
MLIIDVMDDNRAENWSASEMIEETKSIMAALNQTVQQATRSLKADMPSRFTLRKNWAQKGIRFERAGRESLQARVFSVDPWLLKQEEGQVWKPQGHVAIPKAARPSEKSLIPRSMFPNALRDRKDVFAFDFSKNASWKPYPHHGIFQRVRGGQHLRILYLLKDKKTTPARLKFSEQVEDVVNEYFDRYYDDDEQDSSYWNRESYATDFR